MDLRILGQDDVHEILRASQLFDGPAHEEASRRFLSEPGHHLVFAYVGGRPVGFISGVETTHPDKGTEMFIYELAVASEHQRRGVATALITKLAEIARAKDCYGMWVVTDMNNDAAIATYSTTGGIPEPEQVVFVWSFEDLSDNEGMGPD